MAAVVSLIAARHCLGQFMLTRGVEAVTGAKIQSDAADVDVATLSIGITGLRVLNPPHFPTPVMADIPELFVDYQWEPARRHELHFQTLRIYLKELTVIQARDGTLNLRALSALAHRSATSPAPATRVRVDELDVRIDEVIYVDYRHTPPARHRFPVYLHQRYSHLSDPHTLVRSVIGRALMKTAVARLAGLEPVLIEQGLADAAAVAEGAANQMTRAVTHALER